MRVLKFFTLSEHGSFVSEVNANLKVNPASLLQVLMLEFVGYEGEKLGIELCGEFFTTYAYIVLPYCDNGTVLDLLMKANALKRRISSKL